jgi:hypothetical protein
VYLHQSDPLNRDAGLTRPLPQSHHHSTRARPEASASRSECVPKRERPEAGLSHTGKPAERDAGGAQATRHPNGDLSTPALPPSEPPRRRIVIPKRVRPEASASRSGPEPHGQARGAGCRWGTGHPASEHQRHSNHNDRRWPLTPASPEASLSHTGKPAERDAGGAQATRYPNGNALRHRPSSAPQPSRRRIDQRA